MKRVLVEEPHHHHGVTMSLLPPIDGVPHLHVLLGESPGLAPVVHTLASGEHCPAQDAGAQDCVSLQQGFTLGR